MLKTRGEKEWTFVVRGEPLWERILTVVSPKYNNPRVAAVGVTVYAKCIPRFPAWKWKPGNITYTIRHESTITTRQIEISSWKSVRKFNLCLSECLIETHLICILCSPCTSTFSSVTAWRFLCLQFIHVSMQRYDSAAQRGCEGVPEWSVGGPFLSELHSPAAFNIHHSFLMSVQESSAATHFEDLILPLQRMSNMKKRFQVCAC